MWASPPHFGAMPSMVPSAGITRYATSGQVILRMGRDQRFRTAVGRSSRRPARSRTVSSAAKNPGTVRPTLASSAATRVTSTVASSEKTPVPLS